MRTGGGRNVRNIPLCKIFSGRGVVSQVESGAGVHSFVKYL